MKKFFGRVRPSDALLTTRWLDVSAGVTWILYSIYALVTVFSPIPTFALAGAPDWYSSIWSICLGVSAGVAAVGVAMLFWDGGPAQITKKRIELNGIWIMIGFMLVYEFLLFFLVAHGDTSRLAQVFNIFLLLPFPAFRIYHLTRRIRLLLAGSGK